MWSLEQDTHGFVFFSPFLRSLLDFDQFLSQLLEFGANMVEKKSANWNGPVAVFRSLIVLRVVWMIYL